MINDKNESFMEWNQTKEIIEYDSFYAYKMHGGACNNHLCKTIKQIDG